MGIMIIYFAWTLLSGGIMIYPTLIKKFPKQNSISIINSTLVYVFILEFLIRCFLQQLAFIKMINPQREHFKS